MNRKNFEKYFKHLSMLDKKLTGKQIPHYTCVQDMFGERVGMILVITKKNQIMQVRESAYAFVNNENSLSICGSKIQKQGNLSVDDAYNLILENV